ncbi:MAG TPA: class F sortase [Kineosporiaceae bacterium]|nr:class F sortase [Kineosporiaceae bacterium]
MTAGLPPDRSGRGAAALLAVLGVYGVALVATGVLSAIGFGTGRLPVREAAGEESVGRPVQAAPVVVPAATTLPGLPVGVATPSLRPSALPSASLGTDIPARPAVFVPAQVVLPDGTTAPVVPVGLHGDGALVIPDDVRTVGWWTGGSKVGEAYGSVVVAGHVDSATRGIGVFAELRQLVPGQVVTVGAGAHQARYRIISAMRVPQAQISQDAGIFAVDGPPQLILVTCGGAFDPVRHRYQDNLVVVAAPVA